MFNMDDICADAKSTSKDHYDDKPISLTEEELDEVMVEIRF